VVLEYEEVSFWFLPVFYSEILIGIFGTLWTWFCFADSDSKSENKSVFLLLLRRFKTFEILSLFFSISPFCDRTEFVAFSDEFCAWIAERRFNDDDSVESLRAAQKLHWFWFNLASETVRVFVNLFFNLSEFVIFWSNWHEREKSDSVCDLALILWTSSDLHSGVALYRLPCGLWTNEILTPGLVLFAWHS